MLLQCLEQMIVTRGFGRGRSWSNQHIRRVTQFVASFYWEYLVRDQNAVFHRISSEVGKICSTVTQIKLGNLRTEFQLCFYRKSNLFSYGFVMFTNNFENQGCFWCHNTILKNIIKYYHIYINIIILPSYHMDQWEVCVASYSVLGNLTGSQSFRGRAVTYATVVGPGNVFYNKHRYT